MAGQYMGFALQIQIGVPSCSTTGTNQQETLEVLQGACIIPVVLRILYGAKGPTLEEDSTVCLFGP